MTTMLSDWVFWVFISWVVFIPTAFGVGHYLGWRSYERMFEEARDEAEREKRFVDSLFRNGGDRIK